MTTRRRLRESKRRRSRRIRALLAAGAVLGVGAAGTLAAWNDSEYATATVQAGSFGIEGATNGTFFSEHDSEGVAAALAFTLPQASAMVPGTTVYALFSVRTIDDSVAGHVQLRANATNSADLGSYLRYGVRTIASTTCNASNFGAGTAIVADGSAMTTDATTWQTLTADGASQVNYCFAVTLPSDAGNGAQGAVANLNWEFFATTDAP